VRAPHVAAAPAPPPPAAPPADFGPGFDEAFAIEAGERELMMEPGDHTVLLGGRGASSSAAPPSAGDDIWGAVEAPASAEEEDSSTVFMAPPPIAAPQAPQAFPSQDYEVQYEADDLDATWRMPNEGAPESPGYQSFDEFSEPPQGSSFAPPPPPIPEPASIPEAPALEMPPPLTPSAAEPVSTFEPYDPFVAAAQQGPGGFEPVSPFETDQTIDSAVSGPGDEFERIPTGGFDAYGEPEIVAESQTLASGPEPVFETNAAHEPFDEIDSPGPSETGEPTLAARASAAPADGGGVSIPATVDDALIEKLAARVVDKLSQKIIQEIAWEVVPELAEGMIQREIDALKAKLAKVPK
jgi:hypothetical protein